MNEALFGSASPMWTAMPLAGFGVQNPMAIGSRPINTPLFSSFTPPNMPVALNQPPGALLGQEMVGLSAPALLTAVAMRRGQLQGPTNDQELEDFISDALDLLPGAVDVEVRCEGGRTTLTGSVPHKRVKRDIGEIAWAVPAVTDVQNTVTIASRRRARTAGRETEAQSTPPVRKQG